MVSVNKIYLQEVYVMNKNTLTSEQVSELIHGIENGDKNAAKELISNYSDSIYFRVK